MHQQHHLAHAKDMTLFDELDDERTAVQPLGEGAVILRGFATSAAAELVRAIELIAAASPFRHMTTPGGFPMSVAMTNCGQLGWVSDEHGYRYSPVDPISGAPWPAFPSAFAKLAHQAAADAGFSDFAPEACLINRYVPDARLTLHQDRDEQNLRQPIVSVSLGLPAVFLWGGLTRRERPRRIRLESGDVVVWGGPSRMVYHGVERLDDGEHPLTGRCRLNLTFRRVS